MRNSMKILCLIIVAVLILLGLSSVFSKIKGKNLEKHVFSTSDILEYDQKDQPDISSTQSPISDESPPDQPSEVFPSPLLANVKPSPEPAIETEPLQEAILY